MSNKTLKGLTPLIVLILGVALAAWIVSSRKSPDRVERPALGPLVEVMPAQLADVPVIVNGHGEVVARVAVDVIPQVAGRVVQVHRSLVAGGFFRANEALVVIDPRDYELALERAQASVARAQVSIQREEAEAVVAREEWSELHPDEEAPGLVVREPQIRQAQAELAAAEADLAAARLNLERTHVSLPFDGVVVSESVDVGQFVGSANRLARVYGTDVVDVRVPLESRELAWFDVPSRRGGDGSPAQISVTFGGTRSTWEGRVTRMEAQVDQSSRMVHVVVEIKDPYAASENRPALLPGTFVDVQISGRTLEGVVPVPRFAIHDGGQVWVFENGRLGVRQVQVLRSDRHQTLVASGIEADDLVIVSSLDAVTDGMVVRNAAEERTTTDEASSNDPPQVSALIGSECEPKANTTAEGGGDRPETGMGATAEGRSNRSHRNLQWQIAMKDSRRGPLAWFAANHVAANILMIFILVSGALAMFNVVIEVFPELETDMVTVRVPYRGASPAEAEEGVCVRVEEAIASIEGIKRIRSMASENLGTVTIELEEDADNREVLDDIKAAVDRIETFPVETEKPVVSEVDTRRRVITIVLHGNASEKTLKALAERVRDELTALENISQAEIAGVRNYEISIEVSEEALRRYGLSFEHVANAVAMSSLDLPGGAVKTRGGEILLRTKGQRYRGAEFEEIVVVTRPDGTQVELSDVATVVDGFEDTDTATRFDGKRAALIQVFRVGSEGALEVAETTKGYLVDLRPSLPEGVSADTWDDDSIILKQRIGLLLRNARLGLFLVFVCLALFLNTRLAFWTTMGIPISFLGGLWLIPEFGVSINMISLFAFIVVLGIVVDDAIVVGENIFNYLEEGMKPLDAAIRGVREMAMPVTFAIITTVAAFAPLLFVAGNMGKVMRQIPIVVIMVLLMSLVEALLILPAHLSGAGTIFYRIMGPILGPIEKVQARVQGGLQWFIRGPYRKSLDLALAWRYLTVSIAVVFLFLSVSLIAGGFLKFSFMPKVDADNMTALLTMPQGTPVDQTAAVLERLEAGAVLLAAEYDEGSSDDSPSVMRHISNTVGQHPTGGGHGPMATRQTGGDSSHLGEVNVELLGAEDRDVGSAYLLKRWREIVGEVPGVVSLTFQSNMFSAGDPVSVQLAHRDFDVLLQAVDRLKIIIAEYPGTKDVADSFLPGKKELKLTLTPVGRAAGLTLSDLARQVRSGFYGREVQRIQRGRDDIRVMVRYPEEERQSRGDIDAMRIRLPDGSEVPFTTVAHVEEGRGYAVINRTDRRRVVTVTADVEEGEANANEISRDLREEVLPTLTADFPGLSFDFEGEQREQQESLNSMKVNFLVAQLAIFALLAIPFKSYTQPLIIMSAIPFGLVGAVFGHMIMGLNMTILSLFGMVALTGVVVNDSLILIDLINRRRAEGASVDQAIRESGERRFRPIMLTTATTFLGLTPMIFETSMQAKFLIPMAVSLGYGIVFATAITLILIPTLYRILEDLKALFGVDEEEVRVSRQVREELAEEGA